MNGLAVKLRIGEKIGIGFGLVCAIFLAVIWQYHATLRDALADYRELQGVHGAKRGHALAIEGGILAARRAEKDFMLHRTLDFAEEVDQTLAGVYAVTGKLGEIDETAARDAARIRELADAYRDHFHAVVEAWKVKGLDHDSGLQGAFRNAVHELEEMAAQLNVGGSYLQLLQIRRGEKDLGLRREPQYRAKVLALVDEFERGVAASRMDEATREQLLAEIGVYREAFLAYSDTALADEDIRGGKGAFRQSAHRIEDLLATHYVPDLETAILQLRRREKDYLLRLDKVYVEMVASELEQVRGRVAASTISDGSKARFGALLDDYQRDFLALVEQNEHIDRLAGAMAGAVARITSLAGENVTAANAAMDRVAAEIDRSSLEKARSMLWVVAAATLLGALFAALVVTRISRPLRRMAGLLDQLAFEEPAERIAALPGGRDEVNAMARSVNTMADHKGRFLDWWKGSMRENDACRRLRVMLAGGGPEGDARKELNDAVRDREKAAEARYALYRENHRRIGELNSEVVARSDELLSVEPEGRVWLAAGSVRQAARSIDSILRMMES